MTCFIYDSEKLFNDFFDLFDFCKEKNENKIINIFLENYKTEENIDSFIKYIVPHNKFIKQKKDIFDFLINRNLADNFKIIGSICSVIFLNLFETNNKESHIDTYNQFADTQIAKTFTNNSIISYIDTHDLKFFDINYKNSDGETALSIASKKNKFNLVDSLLKNKKVDINSKNLLGETPLIIACKNNCIETIAKFCEFNNFHENIGKIDIDIKTSLDKSVLYYAFYGCSNNQSILDYFYEKSNEENKNSFDQLFFLCYNDIKKLTYGDIVVNRKIETYENNSNKRNINEVENVEESTRTRIKQEEQQENQEEQPRNFR